MFFVLSRGWGPEELNLRPSEKVWGFDSLLGLRFFSLSHACDKMKNIFLYCFTKLKIYHLSYFYKKQNWW